MKKDFTQWKNDYGLEFEPNYSKETELDCKAAFEAGQQSKQAEVDRLELKLSEDSRVMHNVIDIERRKCDELQKRIDEVIEYLDGCDSCCDISKLHLIEVLQGDSHEF